MSYSGYLLKIGNYIISGKIIKADSYSAYLNMQDIDPWTDANGYVHRKAVKLKAIKVEFETRGGLKDGEFESFLSEIRKQFVKPDEKGCYFTAYIPETGEYITQYGYMADIQPSIYSSYGGRLMYNPCKFSFVGGVYHD